MSDNSKIRVLHMGLDDRRGGIESCVFNMARNVDWNGFQFDFLCYGENPAFGPELSNMGASLFKIPDRKNLFAYIHALNLILSRGYDVLHLHKNSPLDFLPTVIARRYSAKVVVHAHNTEANAGGQHAAAIRIGRAAIRSHSDLLLACSNPAGEWVFGKGVSFKVFPNTIQLSDYTYDPTARGKLRFELGIPADAFVVGAVGRLTKQKNYPFMIRTFAHLHAQVPNAFFVAAGEGEARGDVEALAAGLGISDSVILLGQRDDIPRLYSAFDCMVVPSLWEGLSFVTLEAQAAGLPCFVSEAVPEEARVTQLVRVLELDEDLWAKAITALTTQHLSRTALEGVAFDAMRSFDVAEAGDMLMRIYRGLLASDRGEE